LYEIIKKIENISQTIIKEQKEEQTTKVEENQNLLGKIMQKINELIEELKSNQEKIEEINKTEKYKKHKEEKNDNIIKEKTKKQLCNKKEKKFIK